MARLKTNETRLVEMAIQGKVASAYQWAAFETGHDGAAYAYPSTGGITYNVAVGDPAFGWEGDHIEAGVSTIQDEVQRSSKANSGYNFLACVGNEARIISGEAKGKKGTVLGTHGGVEHVMIDFDQKTLNQMTNDDKVLVRGKGQGLKLANHPDVRLYSLDPKLLHKMPIKELKSGKLEVGVTTVVPAQLMGSGIGSMNIGTGDYDIMTHDAKIVKKYNIDKLCFGDFVAILDHDNSFGRTYKQGAVSIGVVVHSDCVLAGHGPGVTTVMTTAKSNTIIPKINAKANLARILGIGKHKKK